MARSSPRRPVLRLDAALGTAVNRPDSLAAEEPLEVRVRALDAPAAEPVVVTMRTPGDDVDLALGFLLTEGLLAGPDDVAAAVHCGDPDPADESGLSSMNVIELTLRPGVPAPDLEGRRTFGMTSACGVCGTASIDAVSRRSRHDLREDPTAVAPEVLLSLPDRLREAQRVFARTGGLHAAGLFTAEGDLLAVAEDVGRHNAVDKVLGRAARQGLGGGWPLRGTVLQVSGRASFELVQKAWCGGVPVLSAVSAPSSLAVDLAQRAGMGLAGFVRAPRLNAYAGQERFLPLAGREGAAVTASTAGATGG
ncbi:formate dehydrogenase accessory sulfurtransferase FdhD [Streptomyces sp. NP160]|uniref:formate dehydrogenase accessory sulfurtransferase FdhD n=1 Tax=Streptomyces sp. NP160 TaxID=2586637 RepID=UPI00111B32F8|nr:formate dehydrogenase accessory sulfurtransferase FdhD [Streptomyces sp. NP160]TNM67168.1 formate dehydrogenase accessory sulfurtransferase FdhD [Streptomyces sp. NP160]